MTLRALVVLAVIGVLGYRFLPRWKITWTVPIVAGVVIVVVRAIAYVTTDS